MSEEAFEVECERGLRYAVHDGTSLAGDFYKPTRAANAPVVVAAHGGAWKVGDATDFNTGGLARWPGHCCLFDHVSTGARRQSQPDRTGVDGDS